MVNYQFLFNQWLKESVIFFFFCKFFPNQILRLINNRNSISLYVFDVIVVVVCSLMKLSSTSWMRVVCLSVVVCLSISTWVWSSALRGRRTPLLYLKSYSKQIIMYFIFRFFGCRTTFLKFATQVNSISTLQLVLKIHFWILKDRLKIYLFKIFY